MLGALDTAVLVAYLSALMGMSVWLSRGQKDDADYFVGGRNVPWWAVGLSTMATQTSAISFISIPAFVALKSGGGLQWLQNELALPLAMIATCQLVPILRGMELVSVYEYMEIRYGKPSRYLLSAVFLISRSLGTAAGVHATAIVLSVVLSLSLFWTIILTGVFTLIYDTIGGMKAVIYSDVVQLVVLFTGLLGCVFVAASEVGGFSRVLSSFPPERTRAIELGDPLTSRYSLWPFLIGGFFLYVSYYGTDQSQVQRMLSSRTTDDARRSLILNALSRFPLALLYALLGVATGAVYHSGDGELREAIASQSGGNLDFLVPLFVVTKLPVGLRAVVIAAILSAAMSSLDSSLNALSAATIRDWVLPLTAAKTRRPADVEGAGDEAEGVEMLRTNGGGGEEEGKGEGDAEQVSGDTEQQERAPGAGLTVLHWSKICTWSWGVVVTLLANVVGEISDTVVESINAIGSFFYGPLLAAFALGMLIPKANQTGLFLGVTLAVVGNATLWIAAPSLGFMWYNVTGFLLAWLGVQIGIFVHATAHRATATRHPTEVEQLQRGIKECQESLARWRPVYLGLVGYFFVMLAILGGLTSLSHAPDVTEHTHTRGISEMCSAIPPPATSVHPRVLPFVSVNPYSTSTVQTVLIHNVTLVDPSANTVRPHHSILLNGTYIAASGPAGSLHGDIVLDYTARPATVVPALVGMHQHLFYPLPVTSTFGYSMDINSFPALYLAAGVTTARTAGSLHPYADLATASSVNAHEAIGPRILATAPYINGAPLGIPQFANLSTSGQVKNHVQFWADAGFESFKAYLNLPPHHMKLAIETAHALGAQVAGHVCMTSAGEAAELGLDSIEHGPIVSSDFFPPTTSRWPACLSRTPEAAMAAFDDIAHDARALKLIDTLIAHNTSLTSTLAVLEASLPLSPPLALQEATVKPVLPPLAWDKYLQGTCPLPRLTSVTFAGYTARSTPTNASNTAAKALTNEALFEAAFLRRGGRLMAGADPTGVGGVVAGFADLRNLELMVELGGLTPLEALRVASTNGADHLGVSHCLGSLAVNSHADLIVVPGDPLLNISNTRDAEIVFKEGVGFDPSRLRAHASSGECLVTWA